MVRKKRGPVTGKKQQWADHYTEKAKADRYPARSVYKLMEIQKKFRVIRKGATIVDFGCAPGSWLLYAAEAAGTGGSVLGIDLKAVDIRLPDNATAVVGDVFELEDESGRAFQGPVDVVLSDMAPSTTGRKDIDAARSFELCQAALSRACELLVPGGNFVCKIFQGSEFKQFEQDVKAMFDNCSIFKPESCRKSSKEIYIIAMGKKQGGQTNVRT